MLRRARRLVGRFLTPDQKGVLLRRWNALHPRTQLEQLRAEVFVLSFPKCGRTWLCVMVGRALQQHYGVEVPSLLELGDFGDKHRDIPHIFVAHDDDVGFKRPEQLSPTKRRYRRKKVVLLVRDPRDAIVSYYFHQTKRQRFFQGSLAEFVRQPRGGLETLMRYYRIWNDNRSVPRDFLLVRYEDMKRDPAGELRRVLDFMGLSAITAAEIDDAVAFASFDNMRALEEKDALGSRKLRPGKPGEFTTYKTRKGAVGGFVEHFDGATLAHVDGRMATVLGGLFGYGASSSSPPPTTPA